MARLPGFAKLSPTERIEALLKEGLLTWDEAQILKEQKGLPLSIADQLTENVLSTFDLPFSLAPYFLINGRDYVLPMVTEEPSVVAAASFAAKLIQRSGGFTTQVHQRQMIGEIALTDVEDMEVASKRILEDKETLLQLANEAYPSIVKRGGGARDLWVENKGDFLIVYLAVDPKEAMGANMLNTMLEALTDRIQELSGGQALMAILSNLATRSLVSARCAIDFKALSRNPEEAIEIAHRMELASQLAQVDPYRAATHNKGIFNGIDALVLATGNDWRAIEAGAHAYAAQSGSYKGLSHWTSQPEEKKLYGEITNAGCDKRRLDWPQPNGSSQSPLARGAYCYRISRYHCFTRFGTEFRGPQSPCHHRDSSRTYETPSTLSSPSSRSEGRGSSPIGQPTP